jgi:hypothetical protein
VGTVDSTGTVATLVGRDLDPRDFFQMLSLTEVCAKPPSAGVHPTENTLYFRPVFRFQDPVLFHPGSGPETGSGIRDEHPGSYFENSVSVFWVKNTLII